MADVVTATATAQSWPSWETRFLCKERERIALRTCITCGSALHPERAEKYDYCTRPECQEKNAKGLTMVAIGVNKAADQYEILDDRTRQDMAGGRYHDPRRGSFGVSRPSDSTVASTETQSTGPQQRAIERPRRTDPPRKRRDPWSQSQQKLALIYNEQGIRPDEIAQRLGLSRYTVTQMILAAKNRRER